MAATRQVGVDASLQRPEPTLLQVGRLAAGERLSGQVSQGRATPQAKCLPQQPSGLPCRPTGQGLAPLGDQALELGEVELLGPDVDEIARHAGDDDAWLTAPPRGLQRPAQAGDMHPQRVGGRGGGLLAPQVVDQPLDGDHPACLQQQHRQQRPLLGAPQHDRSPRRKGLKRSQDPKLHRHLHWLGLSRDATSS
jgi:hypothetical protein